MTHSRNTIYGQSSVVCWESDALLENHLRFNPPGCTKLPYEMSPMVSSSSLGNPAMLLLLASREHLDSSPARAIYSLDAASLPWAIQEDVALRILSPRHGEESLRMMERQWGKLVKRYAAGTPNNDVNELHYFYAQGILESMELRQHMELLEEWKHSKRYARPLTVASTIPRLSASNTHRLSMEAANAALNEEDYGELLSRTLEVPIAHRSTKREAGLTLVYPYTKKLWNFPLEVKRSIMNQHELFGLEDIDSFAAMAQEYNEDWATAAWEPWGQSRLLENMMEFIERS